MLGVHDLALDVGAGGNHDAVILYEGKRSFRVHRVAVARLLG